MRPIEFQKSIVIKAMVGISGNYFPINLPILDGKNWEKWCV